MISVRQTSTNIEDIIPFPENMQPNRSKRNGVNRNTKKVTATKDTPKSESSSSSSSTSDDAYCDTIQSYECSNGTCSYQQRRQCAGLLRCYNASSRNIQVLCLFF
jgi:hypothetical protein